MLQLIARAALFIALILLVMTAPSISTRTEKEELRQGAMVWALISIAANLASRDRSQ